MPLTVTHHGMGCYVTHVSLTANKQRHALSSLLPAANTDSHCHQSARCDPLAAETLHPETRVPPRSHKPAPGAKALAGLLPERPINYQEGTQVHWSSRLSLLAERLQAEQHIAASEVRELH